MTDQSFQLQILSPEAKLFSGRAAAVAVPATLGLLTVLKDHAPLMTTLKTGTIVVRTQPNTTEAQESFSLRSGLMLVCDNQVTILKSA